MPNATRTPTSTLRATADARWHRLAGLLLAGALAAASVAASAQEVSAQALAARYETLAPRLKASPMGLPLVVESSEDGGRMRGEVHALIALPFDQVVARLKLPAQWCRVLVLHLNVKGCLHDETGGRQTITLLSGRKGYESLDSAQVLRFAFRVVDARAGLLHVELAAPQGPLSTSDYRITLAVIPSPRGDGGSFVRLAYGYDTSMVSRMATSTYLATLGQGKVGFSIVGSGADGKPVHVGGSRGIVERNAVRYYLAIQAELESPAAAGAVPPESTFRRWFDLTERWPQQLRELDWTEYIDGKKRERAELAQGQRRN